MGLFGQSTPFDADIEKATSETNTNENWGLILDVCDKVGSNPRTAKDCLKTIMKRMGHADPHVVMQAITLLDACANNCGKPFHLEIASREFENEFRRLLTKAQPKVSLKMRQVLKNWAENDFKTDSQLNLIPSLYLKLRLEGYDFSNLNEKPVKSAAKLAATKDPNVVSSQQEEDDIAKAIELSLKESKGSPKQQSTAAAATGAATTAVGGTTSAPASSAYPSLYPSFAGSGSLGNVSAAGATATAQTQPAEARKVRALYDFEAAEENELTFYAGEFIHVLDDSDPNWWKGYNHRGDGLFPSNFVTADLSAEPERLDINQQQKQQSDAAELQQKTEAASAAAANQRIEVEEQKIDRLLHLLHEANPEDPSQDSDEMLRLEQEVHQMGPLIDAELERVDRKHAQLTQLSSDLVDAINLYHSLMRNDSAAGVATYAGMLPGVGVGYPGGAPQMLYAGAAGYSGNFAQASQPMAPPPAYGGLAQTAPPPIPLAMQNGHHHNVHAAQQQLNGPYNGMPPPQMLPQQHQQQQQLYGAPQQMPPGTAQQQQQQQPPTQQQAQPNYQMLPPPSQQQPAFAAQAAGGASQQPPGLGNGITAAPPLPPQQQQQQQPPAHYMSPQHQTQQQAFMAAPPQQQQQYAPSLPNNGGGGGGGMQQGYMVPPHGAMLPQMLNNNPNAGASNNNNSADQYSQLQQQMAAMAMLGGGGGGGVGAGMGPGHMAIGGGLAPGMNHHQPVTQSFLVQNEPKNNIPIYQQQR